MEHPPSPRVAGVICEFNPFHSGHAYLLGEARRAVGVDGCVLCLMSGYAVQRGELAIADPYLRARAALAGGADLVLELPFPQSAGSAAHFATAGVSMLSRLGVDRLVFGSECGDVIPLAHAAEAVNHPTFGAMYAALCSEGSGSAAAYAAAIRRLVEDAPKLPTDFPSANDLLGINYLAAMRTQAPGMRPVVVRREGRGYHDTVIRDGEHPSATALRAVMEASACDSVTLSLILEGTMPPEAVRLLTEAVERGECPLRQDKLATLYHAFFRLAAPSDLAKCAEMGGGVAAYIGRIAAETATPEDFMATLPTKQYTDAKLRRALLFGLTGVTEDDLRARPAYTILLAANPRGCAFLRRLHKNEATSPDPLPIITKPSGAPIGRQRELAERMDALFTLCYPTPQPAGAVWCRSPWVEKDEG